MKVRVLSDLHLEFNDDFYLDIPEGDVLVLAGDICLAADYDNYHPFFEQCVAKYNKVFYVMGNHEAYHSSIEDTRRILKEKLPKEISLLDNRSEYYLPEKVHFIGATLWTNFNNLDIDLMQDASQYMNDYHLIDGFTPEKALQEHLNTHEWFERCIPTLKKGKVIVVTHHAPSQSSVKGRYIDSKGCYGNDMDSFIQKNSSISHWIHGHIHHNNDYMIGDCRVISNTRGYFGQEMNPEFNIGFEFEV
jgi:predicted phosphohydrolase